MKTMELTTHQTDLLFQVAEKHLEWYKLYYDEPPKFEVLLELNHTKLSYIIDEDTKEQDITDALNRMLKQYETMVHDYGKGYNDNFYFE